MLSLRKPLLLLQSGRYLFVRRLGDYNPVDLNRDINGAARDVESAIDAAAGRAAEWSAAAKPGYSRWWPLLEGALSIRADRSKTSTSSIHGTQNREEIARHPQIKDATSDQQFRGLQENVVIDRDAAARLGIQPQAVDSTLYSAFGQRRSQSFIPSQNQYHVVLEVDPKFQLEPSSLDKIYVKSASGNQVPLSTIAHFQASNTPLSVNHQGQVSLRDNFI